MRKILAIAVASTLTVFTFACVAQEEEDEGPRAFTYATYFSCPGGALSRADEIIAGDAERWDGFVEDGTISAWGYLSHHTGGGWQRIFYYQAETMDALLDAYDATGEGGDDRQNQYGLNDNHRCRCKQQPEFPQRPGPRQQ